MIPFVGSKYTINVEKLETKLSANKQFWDNLDIKTGSKILEQMGEDYITRVGLC